MISSDLFTSDAYEYSEIGWDDQLQTSGGWKHRVLSGNSEKIGQNAWIWLAARPWRVVKVMLKISMLPLSNSSLVFGQSWPSALKPRKFIKLQICTQCQIAYAIVQSTKARFFGPHGIIADMSQANLAYALHWIRDNHMRETGHTRIEIYSKSQTLTSPQMPRTYTESGRWWWHKNWGLMVYYRNIWGPS